jgi:hypothetical protein
MRVGGGEQRIWRKKIRINMCVSSFFKKKKTKKKKKRGGEYIIRKRWC